MNGTTIFTPEEEVGLRRSLDERYQNASDMELYDLVSSNLHRLTPEQAESWWSAIKDYGSKALPGVIQGATAGSALGPWGALAGGVIGGVSGALSSSRPSQVPSPQVPSPQVPSPQVPSPQVPSPQVPSPQVPSPQVPSPQVLPKPSGVAQPLNNTPAAAQLLQLVQNPQLKDLLTRSLSSLTMGASGSKTIPVGGSQVAPSDFLNLLNVLAASAIKEAGEAYAENASETGLPESSPEFESIPEFDQANPEQRSEHLSNLLQREERSFRTEQDPYQEFISKLEGGNFTIELIS